VNLHLFFSNYITIDQIIKDQYIFNPMIIGIPKEVKPFENRVGLIPFYVKQLVDKGHKVIVQQNAGLKSSIIDDEYVNAGAQIVSKLDEIYKNSDFIIKVKEPQDREYSLIQESQVIFSFFHFPSSKKLVEGMLNSKCIAITYETLETKDKKLPILTPMSSIAGKLAVHQGMNHLENIIFGGKGVLLGGEPGVPSGNVVILGAGVVGTNACFVASYLRANVILLDINLNRLRELHSIMPHNVQFLFANEENIKQSLKKADLIISAVHLVGRKTPVLIKREDLSIMEKNTVIVDVSIDQGGAIETSIPTTHLEPTYKVDDIIHYCVPNMPSIVPQTSTYVLSHASFPYILDIAEKGIVKSLMQNDNLRTGLNIWKGKITNHNVAETFGMDYANIDKLIS